MSPVKKTIHRQQHIAAPLQFFMYLITFFSLAFVAYSAGSVIFQYINKFFPDPLSAAIEGAYDQSAVKFAIASIFISAPLFFYMMRMITMQLRLGKIQKESKVRKWITYVVLLIAAVIVIGDLIALIFNFLEGDIAARFILKVLTILAVSGSIFSYYFWDIKKSSTLKVVYPLDILVARSTMAVIAILFFAAFFIIDKPSVAREKRIDMQTVNDLREIDNSLRGYFSTSKSLPENLSGLTQTGFAPMVQKETSIEYFKTNNNTFNLCAEFKRSDIEEGVTGPGIAQNEWQHGKGRTCYERIVLESEKMQPVK